MRKETKQNGDILGKTQYSPTTDVEIVVNLQWRYHGEIETLWGDHGDTARLHYGHLNGSILGSWGSPPKRGKSLKTWRKFWGRTSSNGGFLFFEVTFPGPCRAHKVWPWLEIHHLKKSLSPNSCTLLEFCGILFKDPYFLWSCRKIHSHQKNVVIVFVISSSSSSLSSSSLSSHHHHHRRRRRHHRHPHPHPHHHHHQPAFNHHSRIIQPPVNCQVTICINM